MSFSEYDLESWTELVTTLHTVTVHDRSDERLAYEAMANVWSGSGYQSYNNLPDAVLRMLIAATEIGYAAGLNDIRKGDLDAEILQWRPDIADQ
ncbi:hypothetical protein [Kribbella sp. CA-293567]|uniref:hypothetical protein n=1 Tax=Kribbella sp. CA-293567 TaxID=3002436 RepID=UPI0022DDD23E|nr:hypothetical protein [Kribbella sp. CA-293567]WBQ04451.1 hypothetical protein OX958_31370 [Kribbella sp. CA-293567]